MRSEQDTRLLLRQLKDIQEQADRILSGDKSGAAIEGFARYAEELRSYLKKHVESDDVSAVLKEIPKVNYKKLQVAFWQYMLLPYWWIMAYNDHMARNQALEAIRTTKEKYAVLELRLKGWKS